MAVAMVVAVAVARMVATRNAAIAARSQLAASSNKSLTPGVVAVVDTRLGLPPRDPSLGTLQ